MGFKDLLGFFTRLPVKGVSFEDAADSSYLMPFIGLFIGVVFGLVGYLSFSYFSGWIAGIITVISIYLVTGILHLDGFSDFMDAVFAKVDFERAREIMKDPHIGIGGVVSIFILLLTGLVAIEFLGSYSPLVLFKAAVVSELSAKFSMSTVLAFGESPYKGSGDRFIKGFDSKDYVFVTIICLLLSFGLAGLFGVLVLIGPLIGYLFIRWGRKTIGGVNGDIMGGSNEASRILTLLFWGMLL
ncbi:adenosylcobinamide-GDP ribazoletransferase [Methanonatronarchaeum sp. AMET-Sl]|uniref:adenosylcobinamide-GDP ribazoletransferase n=1 Tax=Methanonatronarchaeum sp. AMET-Sl TaxID=3037654 RepID=UPI00244DA467|nr:adenosylcobinamide-GDP ribazoletransferase [Methanonatronarchaeum sp. AMET-Sl]WGI17802.1 adenosylcobinamide-GDP ribazoletransferase [Methanonatronarchaeum sp. AMET-Sl]